MPRVRDRVYPKAGATRRTLAPEELMGEKEMERRLDEEVPAPYSKGRMSMLRMGHGLAGDKAGYEEYKRRRKAARENILQRERMALMRDTKMAKHLSGLESMEGAERRAQERHELEMSLAEQGGGRRPGSSRTPGGAPAAGPVKAEQLMGELPEIPEDPVRRKRRPMKFQDRPDASADQQQEWAAETPEGKEYKGFMKGTDGVVRPVYGTPFDEMEDKRIAKLMGEKQAIVEKHERARKMMEDAQPKEWKPSVVELPGGGKALMTSAKSAVPYEAEEPEPEAQAGSGPVMSEDGKYYRNPGETEWRPVKQERRNEDPAVMMARRNDMQKLEKLEGELKQHEEALAKNPKDDRYGFFNARNRKKRMEQLRQEAAAIRKTYGMEQDAAVANEEEQDRGGAPEPGKQRKVTMQEAQAAKTLTPAEARKLAPGTVYRGTDGKLRRA